MAQPTLPILYQDEALLVVNKPTGMAVHRGWANDRTSAVRLARRIVQEASPVHRLDRATSGVLVFCLGEENMRALQAGFGTAAVTKRYLALVRGILPEQGEIDHPLAPSKDKPKRPALSRYRRLGTFERYSLVEVEPQTGRLHQIRRHLKHISHPIIGDVRYGRGDQNRLFRERFGLHRLALHAHSIAFPHPVTGAPMCVVAPLPDDLALPLSQMGLLERPTV
jgi:tRNA pseudouridine65 synthase